MIILSHDDVADLLPIQEAIEVVEAVMKQVSQGAATLPLRSVTPVGGNNRMGLMPGAIADPDGFEARLKETVAGHEIFRIKGFLDVPGKARRLVVQGVGERFQRYFDRDWRSGETRRSELVVIGRAGLDRAAITASLAAHAGS